MNIKDRIASRMRSLREAKNLTQQELAWRADLDRTFMNQVENGSRNISVETLEKIITGLDVSFSDFFDSEIFHNPKRRKK